jgi:hypothetical protein
MVASKYAVVETLYCIHPIRPDSLAGGSKSQVQTGIYCTKVSIDTLVLVGVLIAVNTNTNTKVR